MSVNDSILLSEEESCVLSGVTIETLRQYSKFGLLEPVEREGKAFYRETDVRSLFYTKPESKRAEPAADTEKVITLDSVLSATRWPEDEPEADHGSNGTAMPEVQESGPIPAEEERSSTPPRKAAEEQRVELQEINRSLREQIEILREERNWLRERIEKLESRSEREQMLLLAETETVRHLIRNDEQHRPKSNGFWSFALPWLGFSKPE